MVRLRLITASWAFFFFNWMILAHTPAQGKCESVEVSHQEDHTQPSGIIHYNVETRLCLIFTRMKQVRRCRHGKRRGFRIDIVPYGRKKRFSRDKVSIEFLLLETVFRDGIFTGSFLEIVFLQASFSTQHFLETAFYRRFLKTEFLIQFLLFIDSFLGTGVSIDSFLGFYFQGEKKHTKKTTTAHKHLSLQLQLHSDRY